MQLHTCSLLLFITVRGVILKKFIHLFHGITMKYKSVLIFLFLSIFLFPQTKQTVLYAHIDGEIDLGKAPFVRRAISSAESAHASAIVFEIYTFGGRDDAATQIKDAILESRSPTVAFINKRAVSAGALISLACQTIIMSPGSIIGASTVVDEEGKKQSEKYQSYMRSEMRSTAEKNGRRGDLAEAMVDERVVIPGIDDSTKLLSLTYQEAESFGICDTILDKKGKYIDGGVIGTTYQSNSNDATKIFEKNLGMLSVILYTANSILLKYHIVYSRIGITYT